MKKPFVHLFETINGQYFYDVNTNEIVYANPSAFAAIKKLEQLDNEDEYEPSQYPQLHELMERGYLSDHKVTQIKHSGSDLLDIYLNRGVSQVTLQVTQRCNLRCAYCTYADTEENKGQRMHSNKDMSLEMAKKAIDFYYRRSIDIEQANIGFYGGEPLLKFSLIKELIEYCEYLFEGKPISYSVTTNGTLLTDEVIDLFAKYDVRFMISTDGPEHIHDRNRRFAHNKCGSFQTMIQNIARGHERYPEYVNHVSTSMVMDPQNGFREINQLFENYEVFGKASHVATIIDDTYKKEKISIPERFRSEIVYEQFLSFLKSNNLVHDVRTLPMADKIVFNTGKRMERTLRPGTLPDTAAPGGPCIPGQRKVFIDVDGNIFPCERISESSPAMCVGHVDTGWDIEKCLNLLNIGALTQEDCRNCWAFIGCQICAKYADNGTALDGQTKKNACGDSIYNFENMVYTKILMDELNLY